jgi:spore cortex formation protein SpoVR/YcgB (stage V sporulation)
MKRFTFWRNAIVSELYVVDAENEDAALEMLNNGEVEVFSEEWVDWATDHYELEHIEIIDPLYRMVKGYKSVDNLVK